MTKTPAGRAATLHEVALRLDDVQPASMAPRSADAPPLVSDVLARPAATHWGTDDELSEASAWFLETGTILNQPAIETCLSAHSHELRADWRWPDRPLVEVRLDGTVIASVDYLPASASAHWFVRWENPSVSRAGAELLPLIPLAARVPEEAEEDEGTRLLVLDAAVEATATGLTGRPVVDPCVPADCGCPAPPYASGRVAVRSSRLCGGGGPDEAGELAGDGDVDHVRWLLVRAQASVDAVQAVLGTPRDLQDVVGQPFVTAGERDTDARLAEVVPGRLDEDPPGVARAGLGDRPVGVGFAGLLAGGHQSEPGAELHRPGRTAEKSPASGSVRGSV